MLPVNDRAESVNGTRRPHEETTGTVDGRRGRRRDRRLTASCTSSAGGTVRTKSGSARSSSRPRLDFNRNLTMTLHAPPTGRRHHCDPGRRSPSVSPGQRCAGRGRRQADFNRRRQQRRHRCPRQRHRRRRRPPHSHELAAVGRRVLRAVPNAAGIRHLHPAADITGSGDSSPTEPATGRLVSERRAPVTRRAPAHLRQETVLRVGRGRTGSFTRLDDPRLQAVHARWRPTADTVLFQPSGDAQNIGYRGVVSFGVDVAPPPGASPLRLQVRPLGGTAYQPMLWCHSPQFDTSNILTTDARTPPPVRRRDRCHAPSRGEVVHRVGADVG